MRALFWIILVAGLAAAAAAGGVYVWKTSNAREEQEERDHSPPAFCAKMFSGIRDVCWLNESECERRGIECTVEGAYACFRAETITDQKKLIYCRRLFGECADYRTTFFRDAEYTNIGECLIYRSQDIRVRFDSKGE